MAVDVDAGIRDPMGVRLTQRAALVLALCSVAALVEGFDIQAMGVAGPRIIREFALTAVQASWLFAGGTLGQAVGSTLGGRLGDLLGRRSTLIGSLALVGLCALGTVLATTRAELLLTRLLAGCGLGAALPNFITIASESLPPAGRQRSVTLLMAGLPLGGLLASLTSLANGIGWGWRMLFVVGCVVPLLTAALMTRALPAPAHEPAAAPIDDGTPDPPTAARIGLAAALWTDGRAPATVFLGVSFFFTQLILLLMVTWLPSLVVRAGFSFAQATVAQICFNVSGILGGYVVGRLQSGARGRTGVAVTYCAIALALCVAGLGYRLYAPVLLAAAASGVFISGGQLALYALAPLYYARPIRSSGVGAASTAGRLGSIAGPLLAGVLLAGGGSSATVLLGIEPFVLIGGAAAWLLGGCRQYAE